MLWTIIVILLVLWLLGLIGNIGGGLIWLLLVIAAIVLVFQLLSGRQAGLFVHGAQLLDLNSGGGLQALVDGMHRLQQVGRQAGAGGHGLALVLGLPAF